MGKAGIAAAAGARVTGHPAHETENCSGGRGRESDIMQPTGGDFDGVNDHLGGL